MQQIFGFTSEDELASFITKSLKSEDSKNARREIKLFDKIEEMVASLESFPKVQDRYNLSFLSLYLSNEKFLSSII